MGYGYAYDPPGVTCTGGPTPGTVALSVLCRRRWPLLTDLGIYNCRRVRGGRGLSLHAEGRAADLGTPTALAKAQGHVCATWLVSNAEALGVQEVIYFRRRWASNTREWRPYRGSSPHTDHVHVALCRAAAQSGTVDPDATSALGAGRAFSGPDGPEGIGVLAEGATWVRVTGAVVGVTALALSAWLLVKGAQ